jgi:LysM repeat protein
VRGSITYCRFISKGFYQRVSMKRSSLLGFIVLNVVVTFATVFAAIGFLNRFSPQPTPRPVAPPIVMVVTSTPDPKGTQVEFIVVTATPGPNSGLAGANGTAETANSGNTDGVASTLPNPTTDSGGSTNPVASTAVALNLPTLDPALLPPSIGTGPNADGTASADGSGSGSGSSCQEYTIKKGDLAGNIAQTFGVSLDDLMNANQLTEADLSRLQIGQKLIVPINGCGLATEEPTPTITPTRFDLPTLPPTSTIAPTAATSQIEVVQVITPGDITGEGVELRNISGGVIQMKDWVLADATGLKFTFPDYRMFPGGRVTVYTRAGTNTPIVLYWGQSRAVWSGANQAIKITDAQGEVQASYSLTSGSLTANPNP